MVRFSFKITMLSRRWPISTVSGSTVCPALRLLLGMVVDLEDALGRASSSGASKSQPRPTIAGRPICLGERKPASPTCRDEVVAAIEALVAGGGAPVFTVENVHAAMVSCGSAWSRETVARRCCG